MIRPSRYEMRVLIFAFARDHHQATVANAPRPQEEGSSKADLDAALSRAIRALELRGLVRVDELWALGPTPDHRRVLRVTPEGVLVVWRDAMQQATVFRLTHRHEGLSPKATGMMASLLQPLTGLGSERVQHNSWTVPTTPAGETP